MPGIIRYYKSKSKYGNKKTVVDGHTFASKKEAKRYGELKLLEQTGKIHHLELQPDFNLVVNGTVIGRYRADFRYLDDSGAMVIEDAKGMRLPLYKLKKKIMEANGFKIVEV